MFIQGEVPKQQQSLIEQLTKLKRKGKEERNKN